MDAAKKQDLVAAITPLQMLDKAMEKGVDAETLQKFMDLHDRWQADQARKAYVQAMTAFKSDPPAILKNKSVNIPGGARFAHASLAQVVDGVCAALSKYGLSHRWETKQDGGTIAVTCILTHEAGHSERTTLSAAPDDSGKKNGIQQIASTVTYLERYTLMAATGLAARDMDDDGRGANGDTLNEKQVVDLEALITEVGADRTRFLKHLKVSALDEILAKNYSTVVKMLEAKRATK